MNMRFGACAHVCMHSSSYTCVCMYICICMCVVTLTGYSSCVAGVALRTGIMCTVQ